MSDVIDFEDEELGGKVGDWLKGAAKKIGGAVMDVVPALAPVAGAIAGAMGEEEAAAILGQLGGVMGSIGGGATPAQTAAGTQLAATVAPATTGLLAAGQAAGIPAEILRMAMSMASGVGTPGVTDRGLASAMIDRAGGDAFIARVAPQLAGLQQSLDVAEAQRIATSEHNTIVAENRFRETVTAKLAEIERRLPPGQTRNRVMRIVMARNAGL